jgi:hypothetical protein
MNGNPRPLLVGYIRAAALPRRTYISRVAADLEAFAIREAFSLGTVFVEWDEGPAAFHAVLEEVDRDETAWGVVVPDLRHVADEERLVMRRQQEGYAETAVLVANVSPRSGGPGAVSPVLRQVCRSTSPK